jgi:phospholipid/cholesterol/gamma-HCH transport system permease protein
MILVEIKRGLETIGNFVVLFKNSLRYISTFLKQWKRIVELAYNMGYRTFPIVGVMSFFIGGVLALQTGYSLGQVGGGHAFLGNIVGLSMSRELGPIMTAFLLAGRVGASITAELASMKVNQEVDALITMNIPPERILVFPRLSAIFFMMPPLTIFSIVLGWYGGSVISHYVDSINLDYHTYWQGLKKSVDFKDIWDGLFKAQFFGLIIVIVSCAEGLRTRGGPREVGQAVTRAVVLSMITVLICDYLITKLQH